MPVSIIPSTKQSLFYPLAQIDSVFQQFSKALYWEFPELPPKISPDGIQLP